LEGITRNYFFMVINLIMVGGQVLIIFVGGAAFQITRLNGKEWGLSIGLGAISLPWGALIRKFPDAWAAALVPKIPMPNIWPFNRKKKTKKTKTADAAELEKGESGLSDEPAGTAKKDKKLAGEPSDSDEAFEAPPAPLRTLTSIRGKRATTHIRRGFREYMHDQKVKVKEKGRALGGGSKVDVSSAPGVGGKQPVAAAER
jgi:Ca2+-transporting ATPase